MPSIDIRLIGDGAFDDVPKDKLIHNLKPLRIAGLSGGMVSGKPSVAIGVFLDDGGCVLTETSLALFLSAADALKAKFGDPRYV